MDLLDAVILRTTRSNAHKQKFLMTLLIYGKIWKMFANFNSKEHLRPNYYNYKSFNGRTIKAKKFIFAALLKIIVQLYWFLRVIHTLIILILIGLFFQILQTITFNRLKQF